MTRYSSAAEREAETEQPSSAQERLDRQNAEQWSRWAGEVNEQLASFAALGRVLMGGEDKEKDPGLLLDLTKQTYDDTRAETAETVKSVSDALSARIEAEVAVLRDEFIERLDALLLNHSPKKLRAMETAIRKDMNDRATDIDALLDKLTERTDNVDKRRRYDRNTSRTERDELATKLTVLFGGMLAQRDKRIDDLDKKLADLRSETAEALDDLP